MFTKTILFEVFLKIPYISLYTQMCRYLGPILGFFSGERLIKRTVSSLNNALADLVSSMKWHIRLESGHFVNLMIRQWEELCYGEMLGWIVWRPYLVTSHAMNPSIAA